MLAMVSQAKLDLVLTAGCNLTTPYHLHILISKKSTVSQKNLICFLQKLIPQPIDRWGQSDDVIIFDDSQIRESRCVIICRHGLL
jgi:hypothetical protein